MYHRGRKKMRYLIIGAVLLLSYQTYALPKSTETTQKPETNILTDDNLDNTIIDFEEDYNVKFNKKYGMIPWSPNEYFNKESNRYTIVNNDSFIEKNETKTNNDKKELQTKIIHQETTTIDFSVIPLELISTTENTLLTLVESTMEPDLTVIPLSTTKKPPNIEITQSVTLPQSTTQEPDTTTENSETENIEATTVVTTTEKENTTEISISKRFTKITEPETTTLVDTTTTDISINDRNVNISLLYLKDNTKLNDNKSTQIQNANLTIQDLNNSSIELFNYSKTKEDTINGTKYIVKLDKTTENITNEVNKTVDKINFNNTRETINRSDSELEDTDVPIFTELDTEDETDIPEDYYDTKDVVPTTAPKSDALSVIFGLAGSVVESVVESVAERVVPKGLFDLFKRMQRQNEALEAEKLRSPEENGGLGQFTRGILKSISSGIGRPLSQLMAGVRDFGSLDSDRGFINSLASGVTSVADVANSVVDAFKDRVQAIYPGTVWCGDGRSAAARSSDLGLFFFTDTCCRQHDACKLYITAGDTKYGLTNTGLFTRSHCSCDAKFRDCLRRTNSLVSAQIGLTYFNVLGPQCFRRAHPIVKCVRRTRITGQKCEEYELDYTKPRMWQWFDNETF